MIKRSLKITIISILLVGIIFLAYQVQLYKTTNDNLYKITKSFHTNLQQARQEIELLRQETRSADTISSSTYKQDVSQVKSNYKTLVQRTNALSEKSKQLQNKITELENKLAQFKGQSPSDQKLNTKIQQLKEELRIQRGQITSLKEKKLALQKNGQALRELKQRIKLITDKQQARIDQVKSSMGNNGYVVKNGESTLPRSTVIELKEITIEK